MKKNIIWIIILAVFVFVGWKAFTQEPRDAHVEEQEIAEHSPEGTTGVDEEHVATESDMMPADGSHEPETGSITGNVREFTVIGSNFAFAPTLMTAKKGETVRITFVNSGGKHDLKIDEFHVATKIIEGGAQETIEFVADKVGSFEYYCSVGSHRAMGMKGALTVTE